MLSRLLLTWQTPKVRCLHCFCWKKLNLGKLQKLKEKTTELCVFYYNKKHWYEAKRKAMENAPPDIFSAQGRLVFSRGACGHYLFVFPKGLFLLIFFSFYFTVFPWEPIFCLQVVGEREHMGPTLPLFIYLFSIYVSSMHSVLGTISYNGGVAITKTEKSCVMELKALLGEQSGNR